MLDAKITFSYYHGPMLFNNLEFSIMRGEKILLFGDVESGKTTLFEILCGLNKDYFGEIEKEQNLKISFLPSEPVLFERKTVYDNLAYVYKVSKMQVDEGEIDKILQELNLAELKSIKVKKLSLLDKQKVAVARMLLKQPDLVFVDDLFKFGQTAEFESLTLKALNQSFAVVVATCKHIPDFKFDKFLYLNNQKLTTFLTRGEFEAYLDKN